MVLESITQIKREKQRSKDHALTRIFPYFDIYLWKHTSPCLEESVSIWETSFMIWKASSPIAIILMKIGLETRMKQLYTLLLEGYDYCHKQK